MQLSELVAYLDTYLHISEIKDYGPQGLQVEADNPTVQRIALAVDVSPDIIDVSAEWNADMLLVHHGILWKAVEPIAGPLGARVRGLLKHNMHLYAAHLPLDAHTEVGNNAVLAKMVGLTDVSWWAAITGTPLGAYGTRSPIPLTELVAQLDADLNTTSRVLAHGPAMAQNIAILSGFGATNIAEAKALGADTFVTGEQSHANYWAAQDYGMNVIYAGHYATETVGVQALGQHLVDKFGVEVQFFDFPTRM